MTVQLFAIDERSGATLAVPLPAGVTSIHDALDGLPLGIYTALRTFDHDKFLYLDAHLARMGQSLRLGGYEYDLDELLLCQALDRVCQGYPGAESRVRIDVLAEPAGFPPDNPTLHTRLLIVLAPFAGIPPQLYQQGVRVELAPNLHRNNPLIKTAQFILERRPYPLGHPQRYEHLLLDEAGYILEGSSSNFFGVRDGILFTARDGVLEGIARKLVLELAAQLGIPVQLEPIHINDVALLEEASLSSSSRGLIPIVGVGDVVIGDGQPGAVTQQLWTAYQAFVAANVKPAGSSPTTPSSPAHP